ncbi:MAG: hypothetical protein CSA55_01695 [Ilumatobacter coccineus]|uniref:Uncharacterized protein n=1 Tax=Ilumatobacter coccineus TaxID=467094 RepID=A0A2G6KE91_9ACTN|nr:MAG: hypothetical protein CSA55_01695 [Ilumatobacter coccineus]
MVEHTLGLVAQVGKTDGRVGLGWRSMVGIAGVDRVSGPVGMIGAHNPLSVTAGVEGRSHV